MSDKVRKEIRNGEEIYISADGRVHKTPQAAVDASLNFEKSSNTGAGCSQDPSNIKDKKR